MLAYMRWGNNETPSSSGLKGDHLIGKYYVLFDTEYKKEIEELVGRGVEREEAEKNAQLIVDAREILQKWESGEPETISLWKKMNGWVYEGFEQTYKRLGIQFDKTYHESDTYLPGKSIVDEGLSKGVFFRKDDGSVWVNLTDVGLDQKLLLRADGTSVYITQDLGTAELRFNEFHPDGMIYVVGNEQNYHFDVLKKVLGKLGRNYADSIYHLSYGMVELPFGKMKSREGTVVDADDLMEEMFQTAEKTTTELGKAGELNEKESVELFEMVGLGALKYFILKVDPRKNMLFDPAESIDFNGHTGPFIQYTHARIQSLLKRGINNGYDPGDETSGFQLSLHPLEKEIIKQLFSYRETIQKAADEYNPAVVANYVYELAKAFNSMYQELPVLKEENTAKLRLRLAIAKATGKSIAKSMKLLGISCPDKM
jgi:arginyl-tRNA synthetase